MNSKIPYEQKWFCYIVSVFVADQQWADVWTNGKEQSLWSTFCCSVDLRRIFRVSETMAWIIYVTIVASCKKKIKKASLGRSVSTHFVADRSFLKHFFSPVISSPLYKPFWNPSQSCISAGHISEVYGGPPAHSQGGFSSSPIAFTTSFARLSTWHTTCIFCCDQQY